MTEVPYEDAASYLDRNISSKIRADGTAVLESGNRVVVFYMAEVETPSNLLAEVITGLYFLTPSAPIS